MKRRKRKPVPIPNAEALAAGLREECIDSALETNF